MAQPRNVSHRGDLSKITYLKPKQGCGSSDAGRAKTRQAQRLALEERAFEVISSGDMEDPEALAATAPELGGRAIQHPARRHPALDIVAEAGTPVPAAPKLWDRNWYRP